MGWAILPLLPVGFSMFDIVINPEEKGQGKRRECLTAMNRSKLGGGHRTQGLLVHARSMHLKSKRAARPTGEGLGPSYVVRQRARRQL